MLQSPIPVLINRRGGTAKADPNIAEKVRAAFTDCDLETKVELVEGDQCAKRCKALATSGAPLVIVGGGDGTISAAASQLAGTETALGVLPLGTLNHFARDLGVPSDLAEAADALSRGRRHKVDIAEVNGKVFINNSAIGLYPLMVIDRDSQQKRLGRSKRLALLVAMIRTLARFHHERLTLCANNGEAIVDTPLLFVGNNDYRTDLAGAGRRKSISDGHLCVLVMARKSRLGFVAAGLRSLFNRTRSDEMIALTDVTHLEVTSGRSTLKVALDGEVEAIKPPLVYRIRPRALTVIAP